MWLWSLAKLLKNVVKYGDSGTKGERPTLPWTAIHIHIDSIHTLL